MAQKSTKFIVDSHMRKRGTPGDFVWQTFAPIKDVSSVDLVAAYVPKTMHAIQTRVSTNLQIRFNAADDYSSALNFTLAERSYTGDELVVELNAKMAAHPEAVANALVWSYDKFTNHLSIVNNHVSEAIFIVTDHSPESYKAALHFPAPVAATPAVSRVLGFHSGTDVVPVRSELLGPTVATLGTQVPFGGGAATELPGMLDTSFPRYIYLEVEFGGGFENRIYSDTNSYSFVIPFGDSNHLDIENFTAASDFRQTVTLPDTNISEIRIRYRYPEPSREIVDFQGADNQIIFEAFS